MAEFIFDYQEQIEALCVCGHSSEEAIEMVKKYPLPDEVMVCVKKCYGPFSEGSRITLEPYDEERKPVSNSEIPFSGPDADLPF